MEALQWHTEKRQVASLKDFKHNPRKFTEKGLADLKASIQALGYIDPVAINMDGTIIGGHARKQTLLELGLKEIDVRVPSRKLTVEEVKEAIIRLNKNQAGEWDFKGLADNFDQPKLMDWGFSKTDFNSFGVKGKTDPDTTPPVPEEPVSRPGDIWHLGNHRLMCGDATAPECVTALISGSKPVLMVTDPPYGVNYDPNWRAGLDGVKRSLGTVKNDMRSDWREAYSLFPGNVAYIWHGGIYSQIIIDGLIECGFQIRAQIIWAKPHYALSRGDYHAQHEPCFYAVRKGSKGNWQGDRKQSTLWQISNGTFQGGKAKAEDNRTGHSAQKPVECMLKPMENNSKPGDVVYDPFSGSGTSLIAAEISGRQCLAMELHPAYVDMAVIRWANFTGRTAHLESGGQYPFLPTASAPVKVVA